MRLEILTASGCCCYYPCLLHQEFEYQCCEYYYYAEPTEVVHGAHLEYLEAVKNKRYQMDALVWLAISLNPVMLRGFSGFIKLFEVENFIHYTRLQQKIKLVSETKDNSFQYFT